MSERDRDEAGEVRNEEDDEVRDDDDQVDEEEEYDDYDDEDDEDEERDGGLLRSRLVQSALAISGLILLGVGGFFLFDFIRGDPPLVAEEGDVVTVHYTGTLDNGEQFDSSRGRQPLSFTLGSDQLIAGFDQAIRGMEIDGTKSVHIPVADAYGEPREDLIIDVAAANIPQPVSVGDVLSTQAGQQVTVVEVTESTVTVDTNHPLAGEALNFEIELIDIQKAEGGS